MKQKEVANLFDVSISTIKKWSAEGFSIKGDLREQIGWVRLNRPLVTNAITAARTRKIEVEAKLKELELLIKEGQLLPRAEVVDHNRFVILETKGAFLQLNRTLPPKLVGLEPREQGDIIKREVIGILMRFQQGYSRGKK
jgi:DNA-binding transcriptional MerR regulator